MPSIQLARNPGGMTLLELMTVCCVIGILATITVANYNASRDKAQKASLVENMHAVQICAEAYGADNGGTFPVNPSSLDPYFPGGNGSGGTPGIRPQNPFTSVMNEKLFQESITDTNGIVTARKSTPAATAGSMGQCGYSQCDTNGTSYCVTGADKSGTRVGGINNTTLVLSNQ